MKEHLIQLIDNLRTYISENDVSVTYSRLAGSQEFVNENDEENLIPNGNFCFLITVSHNGEAIMLPAEIKHSIVSYLSSEECQDEKTLKTPS